MYGMVNEGVHTFVKHNFGDETWRSICADASIELSQFDRMNTYDDAITYGLVHAVAKHAGLTPEKAMSVFGEYWVGFATEAGFKNLLSLSGRNFVERVQNLDDMHDRIQMTMPGLKPPSFEMSEVQAGSFELRYYSSRPGLAPMVIGLLHGLAKETGETIAVEFISARKTQDEADVFRVELLD